MKNEKKGRLGQSLISNVNHAEIFFLKGLILGVFAVREVLRWIPY